MEKHLDFTIDFETCSLSANAAVMQVAVVPWLRDDESSPFPNPRDIEPFVCHVDLRTCVVDGFDFDPATVRWWSERSEAAKAAVTDGYPEPIADVLCNVLDYIRDAVAAFRLESICLWCQGPDVDVAILRSLCRRYDVNLEDTVPHTSFRDCRTVILEAAWCRACELYRADVAAGRLPDGGSVTVFREPEQAYKLYDPLPDGYAKGDTHDALYDAVRSSWLTWQALRWIHKA